MTTRKRIDSHSTQYGLWLREQKEIDSSLGYTGTNIDFVWRNYKTGQIMLIEEKRYMGELTMAQDGTFCIIDNALKNSILKSVYYGFHLIRFENTNPEDGKIYLNNILISKEDLIKFLKFELKVKPYF